jgi:hypothetical protein
VHRSGGTGGGVGLCDTRFEMEKNDDDDVDNVHAKRIGIMTLNGSSLYRF